jgi:predicted HTH transcriptional regulator
MRADNKNKSIELKKALEDALGSSADDGLLETIMSTLDKQKLLRYHNDDSISLLSTPGRVIVAILEDPTMTQRALSIYLDLSETMIDRTIKSLAQNGIVTKTNHTRKNFYKVNIEALKNNNDIQHFFGIIDYLKKQSNNPDDPW